jgi:uncharacterized membrane protein YkvA (DUF1232 family)
MTPDNTPNPALPPSATEPPHGRFRGLADSIRQGVLQARLVWHLFTDRRVNIFLKAIPIAGIAYFIFPLDFIPDLIPVLGQVDDLGILIGSFWLFVDLAPRLIVAEHWQTLVKQADRNKTASGENASQAVIDVTPKDKS